MICIYMFTDTERAEREENVWLLRAFPTYRLSFHKQHSQRLARHTEPKTVGKIKRCNVQADLSKTHRIKFHLGGDFRNTGFSPAKKIVHDRVGRDGLVILRSVSKLCGRDFGDVLPQIARAWVR